MSTTSITTLAASNSLADLRERLRIEHAASPRPQRTSLNHAMAAGDILIQAKATAPRGQWLPWLKSCGLSERTAQRYIRLAGAGPQSRPNPTRCRIWA